MDLKVSYKDLRVRNMAQNITGRIFTWSSSASPWTCKQSFLPLMRLGRLTVVVPAIESVNRPEEVSLIMLRRMLIAFRLFIRFCPQIISARGVRTLAVLVWLHRIFLSIVYFLKPKKAIYDGLSELLSKEYPKMLPFQFPNTLLIDSSLNSRDILGLLVIRFLTYYNALNDYAAMQTSSVSPSQMSNERSQS